MLSGGRVAVGTAATIINGTDIQPMQLFIHNDDSNSDIWLGGPDVTVNGGLLLNKLENVDIQLLPGNYVWAISTKEPHYVSWMAQRF